MADDFERVMLTFTTPENVNILNEAFDVLSELNYKEHAIIINNHIADIDLMAGSTFLELVESTLLDFLDDYLVQHDIFINVDKISLYLPFVDMLANFDNYGDPVTILDIVNGCDTPEETIAELLPLFSIVDKEEYINYIESVSSSLIEKIVEITELKANELIADGWLNEPSDENVLLDTIRSRTRNWISEGKGVLIGAIIADGMPLALQPKEYIVGNEDTLRLMPIIELDNNLQGICLASDIPVNDIRSYKKELAEQLLSVTDINKLTQYKHYVDTYLKE